MFKCLGPGDPGRAFRGAACVSLEARAVPCGGAGARVRVAVTTGLGVVFGPCWLYSAKLVILEVC